jgi:hypothetical protein
MPLAAVREGNRMNNNKWLVAPKKPPALEPYPSPLSLFANSPSPSFAPHEPRNPNLTDPQARVVKAMLRPEIRLDNPHRADPNRPAWDRYLRTHRHKSE